MNKSFNGTKVLELLDLFEAKTDGEEIELEFSIRESVLFLSG